MRRAVTVVVLAALSAGCRTVWIHPQATQEKFDAERADCVREGAEAAARGLSAPNWKQCLLDKGWTTTTDFRAADAVRVPRKPETSTKRKGARR